MWQKLCLLNEVSEVVPKLVKVQGKQILVLKDTQGSVFAVKNVCSHEDKPLHKGNWNPQRCELECPAHKALFSISNGGRALCSPAVMSLEMYEVKIEHGEVFGMLN